MTEQQAISWYTAEVRGVDTADDWFALTDTERTRIRTRVDLVLQGEVRRSEMTAGDLAIYFGRYRTVEASLPKEWLENLKAEENGWRKGAGRPLICDYETRRDVLWDCLGLIHDTPQTTNLFRSAPIGNLNLTNLQVPGQLGADQSALFHGWHVTVNKEPTPIMESAFAESVVTLWLGDQPQANRRLVELWREPWTLSTYLPPRQMFRVSVEWFVAGLDRLKSSFGDTADPLRIWVNLETFRLRPIYEAEDV